MIAEYLLPLIGSWPPALKLAVIGAVIGLSVLARYLLFTGSAFGLSQIVHRLAPWRRLQPAAFTAAQIRREIADSLLSVVIFTGVIGVIVWLTAQGWTRIYSDPGAYGYLWLVLQVPAALLIQDWYFYWMHRIVHRPGLYERVHKTHHLSTNPSAFAAFAFHPLEAILEIGVFIAIVMILPMHPSSLIVAGLFSLAYNVYGHLGYEIMPRFIARSPLGYWLNKSAYHNQHHRTFVYNYGLYTVIWDRLHGTMHPRAEQLYDRASRTPAAQAAPDALHPDQAPPRAARHGQEQAE